MKKILILEDDDSIRGELSRLLMNNGYQPTEHEPYDLVLMDINLPGENGLLRCQKLRQKTDVPIIFLTARDTSEDELLAFSVGGDDFIRKPYNSAVLLARIARLLKNTNNSTISCNGVTLVLPELKVQCGEKTAELTKNETRILWCLMTKRLCTRDELIEDLWSNGMYIDENTLYVNVGRLRDKLATIGVVDYIKTVRGVGYRL